MSIILCGPKRTFVLMLFWERIGPLGQEVKNRVPYHHLKTLAGSSLKMVLRFYKVIRKRLIGFTLMVIEA